MSTDEWYTKPKYIEAAREVMGGIDLDPASCAAANEIVKATHYYTKQQNGLEQPWYGRVWLNPPYGRSSRMQGQHRSTMGLFIERLLKSYAARDITQAIVLTTSEVNAKWFYPFLQFLICIPDHRVNFIVPVQCNKYSHGFGTCFTYLGPNEQKFIDVFSQFGHVVKSQSVHNTKPVNLDLWSA